MKKIKVDPRLEKLIPPLQPDERAALEAALVASGGPTDPLVVWKETGFLLDGHNRHAICKARGLPFTVHEVSLPNHAAARAWMLDRALAKRNLTREQRFLLRAQHGVKFTPGEESSATVKQARALLASGDAARIEAALAGRLPLSTAYRAACKPPVQRRAPAPAAPSVDSDVAAHRAVRAAAVDRDKAKRALDRVSDLQATVDRFAEFAAAPIVPVSLRPLGSGYRRACAVALLSDVHFEERVTRTDTLDNEYDLTIARARLARYFRGVEWLIKNQARGFEIRDLVLWLGGDLISGDIHEENLETGQLTPAEAILEARDLIVSGIECLAKIPGLEKISVPCSYGNHARTTDKMRAGTGFGHNLEWIAYCDLARHFATTKRAGAAVQVHTSESEHQLVEVYGKRLAFHHGHRIRYAGGIGGITVPMIKKVLAWDKWSDADFYHFGHFHQLLDLGRIMVNGSVIGANAYAQSIGATPEPPQQGFYILDEKRGKTAVSPVWVAE